MESTISKQKAASICNDLLGFIGTYKMHLNQIAESYGLTPMQLLAMRTISEGGNATGKIAQVMHCDASNVTGIVDRLISLKLATRKEDVKDRRVKTVELTKKGTTVLQNALELLPTRLNCHTLSPLEADTLRVILSKLVAR